MRKLSNTSIAIRSIPIGLDDMVGVLDRFKVDTRNRSELGGGNREVLAKARPE
jgi:hypothetical protein